jgi:hypothetical protein
MFVLSFVFVLAQIAAPVSAPGEALSTRELWSLAVGTFLPLLVAIPMQPGWPDWARATFNVFVCIVVGAVTSYLDGALAFSGFDAVLRSILMVLLAAWASYSALWRHTVAPAIETHVFNVDSSSRPIRT